MHILANKRPAMAPSRRAFLTGSAAAAGVLMIGTTIDFGKPGFGVRAAYAATMTDPPMPNAFIRIAPDNTVTVLIKHLDKGQGVTTGLTTIVAEELDADWAQMRFAFAPANAALYNNLFFGPVQGTGGSTSTANSWLQLRKAGAAARAMLVAAAAQEWQVPGGRHHRRQGRAQRWQRPQRDVRRSGRQGRDADGADRRAAERPQELQAHRHPSAAPRLDRQNDRNGDLLPRYPPSRHEDRGPDAPAAFRRDGEIRRCLRRQIGEGRGRRGDHPAGCRGDRRGYLCGDQGARRAARGVGRRQGRDPLDGGDLRRLPQARRAARCGRGQRPAMPDRRCNRRPK